MGRHVAHDDSSSLMRWAEGLRTAPGALRELAGTYRRLASEAEDVYPMAGELRESIRRVATRCDAAAERSDGWYPTARATMAADFAAYEQPRDGSLEKERRADVARAHDGAGEPVPAAAPAPAPAAPAGAAPAKKRRPLRDALKLDGKIPLEDGETLLGSSKVEGEYGGTVRVAVTAKDGKRRIRLGIGGPGFGSREDEAGPWRASPDRTEQINAKRAKLREEENQIEARCAEIEAAEIQAKLSGDGPLRSLEDIRAERAQVEKRLHEIDVQDAKVNAARGRKAAGEDVDPAELDPPPYCEPGEYDRLVKRVFELRDLDRAGTWDENRRPGEPGEYDRLSKRYAELEDTDTNEVYPSGYTAQLDADSAAQLRDAIRPALAEADAAYAKIMESWDKIDRLEAQQDKMRGMDRVMTDAEAARWDRLTAEIEALKAQAQAEGEDTGYQVFAEGSIPGEWADVHYRVELDEEVDVILGAVPHGSDRDLSDLSGDEQAASLKSADAKKVLNQIDQAIEAPDGD